MYCVLLLINGQVYVYKTKHNVTNNSDESTLISVTRTEAMYQKHKAVVKIYDYTEHKLLTQF